MVRIRRPVWLLASVVTALTPRVAAAQRPWDPPPRPRRAASLSLDRGPGPGDRVRIWTADRRAIGFLIALTEDTLVIAEQEDRHTVLHTYRTGTVRSFEVSRGRHGHPVTGIFVGALFGAAAGLAIGDAVCASDDWCFGPLVGLIVGPPSGALLGGITGALIRTDRWVTVSGRRMTVSIAPTGRGVAIGVRLRTM